MEGAKDDPDRPEWMGTLDFSGLKINQYEERDLLWYTIIHMTFIVSGVAVALMDWIVELSHKVNAKPD